MPSSKRITQLPSTAGIADDQTRVFLDSVASMLNVRNGEVPAAEVDRFITRGEIEGVTRNTLAGIFTGGGPGGPILPGNPGGPGSNADLIDNLAESILQSDLFRRLGERIDRVSVPWDTIDNLSRMVTSLTSGFPVLLNDVTQLKSVSATSVTLLTALNTTVGTHSTDILQLYQTDADTATALTSLSTRMTGAEGSITTLDQVVLDPNFITATSVYGLIASMGNVVRTYWQDDPPSGATFRPGDRWFDTGETPPGRYYWENAWVRGDKTLSDFSYAGITDERTARVERDLAIASAVNNIWAMLGGTMGAIEDGSFVSASDFGVNATKWNTVYSSIVDSDGNNIMTAVRQDLSSEIDRVTNMARATYTVRVEVSNNNRYVVGGFGVQAEYTDAGSRVDFGVRADRFFIAAPDSGGAPVESVPFMALTTRQTVDGVVYQPGIYIDNAIIADASIDIAKIKSHIQSDNFDGSFVTLGDFEYIDQSNLGTEGWAIDRSGFAVFSNAVIRDTCTVGRLAVTGAVEGYVNVPNNDPTVITHGENRKVMVTVWSANGNVALTHMDDNSFTVRLDLSSGGTVYYRYW